MPVDLNRMREAFLSAAAWCGWGEGDREEIGAEIRAAVEAGNEEALVYWSKRLEELAGWDRLARLCRAAEERIHAAAASQRKAVA